MAVRGLWRCAYGTARARLMEAVYDDDGDFGDWASEDADLPVASFLDTSTCVASAADAWEELRRATSFDYAAWRAALPQSLGA